MSDHVYRVTEVVGSSADSIEQAINTAIETASGTLRNMTWFELSEIRGDIRDGKVSHYQVGIKIGFRYES